MKTELDECFEVLLNRLCYNGSDLFVEVTEQFVNAHKKIEINSNSRKFTVVFTSVISHLLIEEVVESIAGLVQSNEEGFLRKIENESLSEFLGLDVSERYEELNCFALLTSHEILFVFCESYPKIKLTI